MSCVQSPWSENLNNSLPNVYFSYHRFIVFGIKFIYSISSVYSLLFAISSLRDWYQRHGCHLAMFIIWNAGHPNLGFIACPPLTHEAHWNLSLSPWFLDPTAMTAGAIASCYRIRGLGNRTSRERCLHVHRIVNCHITISRLPSFQWLFWNELYPSQLAGWSVLTSFLWCCITTFHKVPLTWFWTWSTSFTALERVDKTSRLESHLFCFFSFFSVTVTQFTVLRFTGILTTDFKTSEFWACPNHSLFKHLFHLCILEMDNPMDQAVPRHTNTTRAGLLFSCLAHLS